MALELAETPSTVGLQGTQDTALSGTDVTWPPGHGLLTRLRSHLGSPAPVQNEDTWAHASILLQEHATEPW